jgi:hypothetical protein
VRRKNINRAQQHILIAPKPFVEALHTTGTHRLSGAGGYSLAYDANRKKEGRWKKEGRQPVLVDRRLLDSKDASTPPHRVC